MIVKYIIDRNSLYNGEFENANMEIVKGSLKDKLELKTHLPVIYRIAKNLKRKEKNNDTEKE